MPYTPPTLNSPSASYQTSPTRSPGPRPNLPRSNSSTAYLSKHRRSPSWQGQPSAGRTTSNSHDTNSSILQSPPPMTDSSMPPGAIISPPDSAQNSSDDDEPVHKSSREVEGLLELEEAVRLLDMSRVPGSPPSGEHEAHFEGRKKLDLRIEMPRSDSNESSIPPQPALPTPPRLSASARKISHSRSATESSVLDFRSAQSAGASLAGSDDSDADGESGSDKPPLLRKKSGELVKPALRPCNRRKHSSMPGTPTYSKAVHFNDDIEQVRHFLQVDKPIAVSAGTSPVGGFEDETEFPFGHGQGSSVEWEIRLSNFPRDSLERLSQPIRLERIFLSPDQKSLIGVTAAANLAFHKQVVARFTLDYWQTTSEVAAEFNDDARQKPTDDGNDQFNFSIKISDLANLESKTMFICIRYNVNGQEYWDNNNSTNYQVDFLRKLVSADSKSEKPSHARSIPRSKHNSSSSRPRSIPSFDDDFASSFDPNSIRRFRTGASGKADVPDTTPPRRQGQGSNQFGSRYDFGASLSAALSQAQAQLGDGGNTRVYEANDNAEGSQWRTASPELPPTWSQSLRRPGHVPPVNSGTESPRPDALLAKKQPLDSRAYQDFVSKFCFFGTSKSSSHPQHVKPQHLGGIDGAKDDTPIIRPPVTRYNSSVANYPRISGGVQEGSTASSPGSSGNSSPLPMTEPSVTHASHSAPWSFPFSSESRPKGFTQETRTTPTAIQG